jgi:hypothetical protein
MAGRQGFLDALTPEQVEQLIGICEAALSRLDPDGAIRRSRDPQAS